MTFLLTWLPVIVGMIWGSLFYRVVSRWWHARTWKTKIVTELERNGWELIDYHYLGNGEVIFEAVEKKGAHDADHSR